MDSKDLFEVYSDPLVLPFLNSDNCHGSNFYCSKQEYMDETIKYWLKEYYETQGFVRFSILDKKIKKAIGTIEVFHRDAKDYFTNCGLLRLDVARAYEKAECIQEILSLCIDSFYELFHCDMIATKAPLYAIERIEALKHLNFIYQTAPLIGHDGRKYYDYWKLSKKNE